MRLTEGEIQAGKINTMLFEEAGINSMGKNIKKCWINCLIVLLTVITESKQNKTIHKKWNFNLDLLYVNIIFSSGEGIWINQNNQYHYFYN